MSESIFNRLATIYKKIDQAYKHCADYIRLDCSLCSNNCCNSFSYHSSYIEWTYLLKGLRNIPPSVQKEIIQRSFLFMSEVKNSIKRQQIPTVTCPLCEENKCLLYAYRPINCRFFGVGSILRRFDGGIEQYLGCFSFSSLYEKLKEKDSQEKLPILDRTPFYEELLTIEKDFLKKAKRKTHSPKITIAEMILAGPPQIK